MAASFTKWKRKRGSFVLLANFCLIYNYTKKYFFNVEVFPYKLINVGLSEWSISFPYTEAVREAWATTLCS